MSSFTHINFILYVWLYHMSSWMKSVPKLCDVIHLGRLNPTSVEWGSIKYIVEIKMLLKRVKLDKL